MEIHGGYLGLKGLRYLNPMQSNWNLRRAIDGCNASEWSSSWIAKKLSIWRSKAERTNYDGEVKKIWLRWRLVVGVELQQLKGDFFPSLPKYASSAINVLRWIQGDDPCLLADEPKNFLSGGTKREPVNPVVS